MSRLYDLTEVQIVRECADQGWHIRYYTYAEITKAKEAITWCHSIFGQRHGIMEPITWRVEGRWAGVQLDTKDIVLAIKSDKDWTMFQIACPQ